jgi:hypothetical protein
MWPATQYIIDVCLVAAPRWQQTDILLVFLSLPIVNDLATEQIHM